MPDVSVLMPCYNASETLDEAMESLVNQTFKASEIIAVDDGSTDNTISLLRAWEARNERVKVLTQPHTGIIAALNYGMKSCQSEYIARMDADDRCSPFRLERQSRFLEDHPEVALVGCMVKGFPEKDLRDGFKIYMEWQNSLITHEDIQREIFIESPFAHPSVMIRKGWLNRATCYQDHGWAEDYDLWLRLYSHGAQFGKVPEYLVDWRETPERLTRKDSRYSIKNFLRAKAYYLSIGPLKSRDAVIIWGAGMMGRRLGKQLQQVNIQPAAYIDIDPNKIGHTKRGAEVFSHKELPRIWEQYHNPVILAAVGARGARILIREQLKDFGFLEGLDWWGTA